eukprot:m.309779 g.309779  ORF g.309779 m.309779 type:complete len:318 (+) comp47751_c0_seq1:405-1358(+)
MSSSPSPLWGVSSFHRCPFHLCGSQNDPIPVPKSSISNSFAWDKKNLMKIFSNSRAGYSGEKIQFEYCKPTVGPSKASPAMVCVREPGQCLSVRTAVALSYPLSHDMCKDMIRVGCIQAVMDMTMDAYYGSDLEPQSDNFCFHQSVKPIDGIQFPLLDTVESYVGPWYSPFSFSGFEAGKLDSRSSAVGNFYLADSPGVDIQLFCYNDNKRVYLKKMVKSVSFLTALCVGNCSSQVMYPFMTYSRKFSYELVVTQPAYSYSDFKGNCVYQPGCKLQFPAHTYADGKDFQPFPEVALRTLNPNHKDRLLTANDACNPQ